MPVHGTVKPVFLVYRFVQVVLFIAYKLFFRFKVYGAENVPLKERGVIFAPNHSSFLDPPALGVALRRPMTFLAKDYLFRKPFLGAILRGLGVLPIRTASEDFRSIRQLLRILKEGGRVAVFPQGTRSADGEIRESSEEGVGFLALKADACVVPVYIRGTHRALPRHSKWFRCEPVSVYFGKPFLPQEDSLIKGSENPYLTVSRRIMDEIRKIKEEVG